MDSVGRLHIEEKMDKLFIVLRVIHDFQTNFNVIVGKE